MLRDKDKTLRIEEIRVLEEGHDWIGKSLLDVDFPRQTGLLIVAVKSLGSDSYTYNPGANYVVRKEDILIVIGGAEKIFKMKRLLGHDLDDNESETEADGSAAPSVAPAKF